MNNGSLSKDSSAIILLYSNLAINSKTDKVKPFTKVIKN